MDRGLLQIGGFTPSDAAHVLDRQSQWSREAAELVCLMIGRSHGKVSYNDANIDIECRTFAQEVFDAMVAKSTHLLLERLSGHSYPQDDPIISSITHGSTQLGDLNLALTPRIPLVAVGGPAQVFYGDVGSRLGITPIIPQGSEVANAIGAAIGMIKANATVEISSAEQGGYRIHHDGKPIFISSPSEALEKATAMAKAIATEKAEAMSAQNLSISSKLERLDIPGMEGDAGLISAKITANCLGSIK